MLPAADEELQLTTEIDTVEGLRKITISLVASTSPDWKESDAVQKKAEFIFGIGTDGLSALEAKLAGKRVGDTVVLSLDRSQLTAVAGHLCRHMPTAPEGEGPVYLHIRIDDVKPADNRNIIQAMAAASACGGGCCGSH